MVAHSKQINVMSLISITFEVYVATALNTKGTCMLNSTGNILYMYRHNGSACHSVRTLHNVHEE